MNPKVNPSGITRRSFIKRSVVAAVAASSMTIFSGLVKANLPNHYPPMFQCKVDKWDGQFGDGAVFPEGQEVDIKFCMVSNPNCSQRVACGKFYKLDANGHVQLGANGQPLTEKVFWNCDDMEDMFGNVQAVTKMCLK